MAGIEPVMQNQQDANRIANRWNDISGLGLRHSTAPNPAQCVEQGCGAADMTAIGSIDRTRRGSILVIGGAADDTRLLANREAELGWRVDHCENFDQAMSRLAGDDRAGVSAVILDENLANGDISPAIDALKHRLAHAPLLLMTAGHLPGQAAHPGISGHIGKPIRPERLLLALRNAASRGSDFASMAEKVERLGEFATLAGTDPTFRAALAQAAISARGHDTILLEGEFGTGKEALARAIHAASPRAPKPLAYVNARSADERSLELMLFGHKCGAFLGAFEARRGMLQEFAGGTLVLDEVNRLPRSVQERLASAMHERCVRPVGARHGTPMDVRIVALSNEPLEDMVREGSFCKELFAKLSPTRIWLPPLRERPGDIPSIARELLSRMPLSSEVGEVELTDDALRLLAACAWPGNVRQLQAALLRAVVFARGSALTARHFPAISRLASESEDFCSDESCDLQGGIDLYDQDGNIRPLGEIESDIVRLAIGHYKGRMTEVARRLGMGRSTLYRRLDTLGIDIPLHQVRKPGDRAKPPAASEE